MLRSCHTFGGAESKFFSAAFTPNDDIVCIPQFEIPRHELFSRLRFELRIGRVPQIQLAGIKTAFRFAIAFLILGGLVALVASRSQGHRVGATHVRVSSEHSTFARVQLTVTNFKASENQMTGSASVEIHQAEGTPVEQQVDRKAKVHLLLYRWESNSLLQQGESAKAMEFNPKPGDLTAEGQFTWTAHPQRSAFFYPFDSYDLYVNPTLLIVPGNDDGVLPIEPIETISTDFTGANFAVEYKAPAANASNQEDWYQLRIRRPLYLRVLALAAVSLLLLWLVYMRTNAKMADAGGVLGLFAGVFSLRSSLLSGAPVSPNLIDYISLLIYISVVLLILFRWFTSHKDELCPFCKSAMRPAATVCASCGRDKSSHVPA